MRILVWASSYGQTIGGGPILAPLLVQALVARGHEICVITDRRPMTLPEEQRQGGAHITRLPFRQALGGDTMSFRKAREAVLTAKRSFRPQLVYMFSSGYGELFHHLTNVQRSVPLVVTLHDRFPASHYAPEALVGRNLRAADWTAACSAAVLATARQSVPEIAGCSSVIWNSVPMPALAGDSRAADPRRLLYAGRLVRQKGVDILLAAFAELKHRYPNLTLDIVGDGPERSALEAEVARLAMTSVVFHGIVSRDQVYMHINKAALVIVPSRFEPFGLVALEAAQMARPVVASDVDGLAEVVERGKTGLLVPPDDAQALAIAIASLLDAPERAVTMGKVAQRRAVACFGWEHFLDGYDELFRRLARET